MIITGHFHDSKFLCAIVQICADVLLRWPTVLKPFSLEYEKGSIWEAWKTRSINTAGHILKPTSWNQPLGCLMGFEGEWFIDLLKYLESKYLEHSLSCFWRSPIHKGWGRTLELAEASFTSVAADVQKLQELTVGLTWLKGCRMH